MWKYAAARLADRLQRDPEGLAKLVEVGVISRDWLERPGEVPVSRASLVEILERFLESEAERRPSALTALHLSTIQMLSELTGDRSRGGRAATLTVAFTDLERFTTFTARAGDDEARRVLADHHRAVGPVVRSHEGRIVKRLGDGMLLTFPAARNAVLAARTLVNEQAAPLRLRAGLHAGEVLVMPDRDVVGHVVNVAARVAELARGGDVLVTEAVRTQAGDVHGVAFGRLRRRSLRGIDEAVRVCHARAAAARDG